MDSHRGKKRSRKERRIERDLKKLGELLDKLPPERKEAFREWANEQEKSEGHAGHERHAATGD
jgi:hypothetical protein